MSYKLFIDDERYPVNLNEWVIVRSSSEAMDYVRSKGLPCFISFDHDLGGQDTSRLFISMLIDYLLDNDKRLPADFDFYMHSQNPVGAKWIQGTIEGVAQEFKEVK